MSFDLYLQRFEYGDSAEVSRPEVLAALRRHSQVAADKFGFYVVDFADGSSVEFSAKGLEGHENFTGCAFLIRGFSQCIVELVFDVAKAGGMVILNAQGNGSAANPIAILTDASQASHLPSEGLPNPVLCGSSQHLSSLLGVGHQQWQRFRDQVMGKAP
ncbi:hypothetical protein [Luteibacter sp. 3190]|uniref:hypothetical protein n=1 Tax=Luteibacter sp. 3190 TaxID=2817736 RepID=UPI0028652D7F|nr:hypothetical protein [Luteibacter sp. 3190]MDR6937471.1 hypothetical protein [Luteibacter sp. 3190]